MRQRAFASVVVILLSAFACARGDEKVLPASAVTPAATAPQARLHFTQRASRPGDRAIQDVDVQMTIDTRIVQSGQVANESTEEVHRRQTRVVDVMQIAEGRATQVRVTFPLSWKQSPTEGNSKEGATQPIEGKSYLVSRDGEASELTVTDLEGAAPPDEERKLVAESLENFGKPNPLAVLFADRTIAVGEKILVPRAVAKEFLGLGDQVGSIRRFELVLVDADAQAAGETGAIRGLAAFKARIEVAATDESPLGMSIDGVLLAEPATCRLVQSDFHGPVTMSAIERTEGGILQYSAAGELKALARSRYGRVAGAPAR